jgi:iron uptake system component EfeO
MTHLRSLALAALCAGCIPPEQQATEGARATVEAQLQAMEEAARALKAAAPAPDADGWNAASDAQAVQQMRNHWRELRAAYERIEGAIAVLFPDLDASTDGRYDDVAFTSPDDNLFDGTGFTGVHAAERILWSDSVPEAVTRFESSLPGYEAPRFPANAAEAGDFRDKLLGRLVEDCESMRAQFAPLELDPGAAFRGVVGSMDEQREKVDLGATGEEESRYARYTLADMRANLAGAQAFYAHFQPWVLSQGADGKAADEAVETGFAALRDAYAALEGDALPDVPADWSSQAPSAAALDTPYGQLWRAVEDATDLKRENSLSSALRQAATLMGIPEYAE